MPDSFGARLRERRERQHIALATIAEQTKIKLSLLDALERDDVSHWPVGIFRRAFIRAYAHAIGLEPDVVVREFLEFHPDPVEEVATVSPDASGEDSGMIGAAPPIRLRYVVGSAIEALGRFSRRVVPRRDDAAADPVAADGIDPVAADATDPVAADSAAPVAADTAPVKPLAPAEPDLLGAAHLCTELGRVDETSEVAPLLEEAAKILGAVGLIVWVWDPLASELRPALAHGYSDKVLAQLPRVRRETDNATAAAFRSAHTCVVRSSDVASGALVVPLKTPTGCVGVFAIELQHGSEQSESVRAVVTILAAQVARLIAAQPAEAEVQELPFPEPEHNVPRQNRA
jgi:transcriptional regulator with XRE-family HTH domain